MESQKLIITIPEPCHEDWNKMLPDEKGKFCNSCSKSVFDFSNKSDIEIKNILNEHKGQKLCGHFKRSQIDRPLNISIDLNNLPKNMSVTKMFVIALFISFGTLLFSCTDNLGKTVGEISVIEQKAPDKERQNELQGQMRLLPDALQKMTLIDNEDMIDGEISYSYSEHVAGGISVNEVFIDNAIKETPLESDTPAVVVPLPKDHIVGMMVYVDPFKEIPMVTEDSIVPVTTFTLDGTNVEKDINSETDDLVIFPNPSGGELTVKYELKHRTNVLIEIIDIKGVTLKKVVDVQGQHTGKYQVPFNLTEFTNGVYLVRMIKNGEQHTQKIILEK